jgi:SulP family sulfate permease
VFKPKLLSILPTYTKNQFFADATAGLILGIVALPLSIAFAIASGVSPEKGLYTAIIAGFLVSALGGSRVQIAGPTGAFVVILYGIVQKYGVDGLAVATLMAGVFLIIMGLVRLGSIIKFIPHPVVVGFTSGIALIIFSSQVKDILGLKIGAVPPDFIDKWLLYGEHFTTFQSSSALIGFGSLALMIVWQRFVKKIPGSLVALIAATVVVQVFGLHVETIGTRFGTIPSSFPMISLPHVNFGVIKELFQPALTIAILGAIEALLSAVVADGMIGAKHRSNTELIAQGIANIASPLFGGIPATGAIARTATNIKNGGRTPIAGMIHSVTLLLIMLFFGTWATLIPLPALSAILIIVAYNMSEWRSFRSVLRSPKSDVAVLLVTFGLTVLVDLTVAIEVGLLLAVFLFMRQMIAVTNVGVISREMNEDDAKDDPNSIDTRNVPLGIDVFEINGPFFFGAAYKFREAMELVSVQPRVRIIRMRNVPAIDATGLQTLKEVYETCKKNGVAFIISDIHTQPLIAIEQSGFLATIGEENVPGDIDESLARAREIMGERS